MTPSSRDLPASWRPSRAVAALILALGGVQAAAAAPVADPGFVLVAPDRGFLGNEELRDAYDAFAAGKNAELVFVTDERTRAGLDAAFAALRSRGARRAVVLPFFLSRGEARFGRVESLMAPSSGALPVVWARLYGESYFAVESLAERVRAVRERHDRRLLVVGTGAGADSRERVAEDLQRLAERASAGLGFESVRAVVENMGPGLAKSLGGAGAGALVVPFHLGSKMDGMMSFTAFVKGASRGLDCLDGDATPSPTIGLWLEREASRFRRLDPGAIGVVALAHGADYHWNETMRASVAPLSERYLVEPAFSMADPVVITRAVRRLEARGARAIVVLRIFGLAASFRGDVERLLGLDVEDPNAASASPHAGHGGHGGHGMSVPPPRLLSSAVLVTTGGMEDHRYFAQALLDRAKALSKDAPRETVILVAHGDGQDAVDEHWRHLLTSLAATMRANGGASFRAIESATWREDWPDKREPAVRQVRAMVEKANAEGGRAIVVPARLLGQGPEKELLEGLSYELGAGFAPHPLFGRWAEEQVAAAVAKLDANAPPATPPSATAAR